MVTLWLFRALSGRDAYWSIYRWNNIFGICLKYSCKKKNNGRGGEIKQKCQMLVILGAGACMQSKCPVLFSLFVLSLTISVTKFLDQQELEELGDTTKEISFASIFFFSRLRLLWEEEVSRHGIDKASVLRVMLRFQRTRLIFDTIVSCCFSITSVLGPVSSRLDKVSGLQDLVISMFRSMPRTGDVLRLPWWVSG